ncbi:LysR family transcriptional regulator [Williamsia serinedens]|uniref:DNA-binding transcriptional regulator, LysR family n=1 Tax=Williamsia serinedens TaxID=391736 RepID=A0ABT1H4M7_9NOCA|nr:LysR family transcriptional regulator [Williamsia serinedens]MCP2162193.1 DNA-binding transcriptional regulator, LysR family [Williamsia serinedens]
MELRQLTAFVTVCGDLSFSRAAERLYMSQSAVSHQVARLERDLGVTLFERSTRSVAVTEPGRRLLPVAEQILELADRARAVVRERASRIRLAANMSFAERALAAIAAVREEKSDVEIEFVLKDFTQRVDAVVSGDVDVALIRGELVDDRVTVHRLWVEDLVVAVARRHPLAGRDSVDLSELAQFPLLLPPRRQQILLHGIVDAAFGDAGLSPRLGDPVAADHTATLDLVNRPDAWTVLYDEPHAQAIARLRESSGRLRVPVCAIVRGRPGDRRPAPEEPVVEDLLEALRRYGNRR